MEEKKNDLWLVGEEGEFISQVIDIDPLQLEEHFRRVPAELAYCGAKYAEAFKRYLNAKKEVDLTFARTYKDILGEHEKKPPVATINATIELDRWYQEARQELVEAEAETKRLRGLVDVVAAKKEMLISLGAHMRAEMSNDPLIKERTYKE